jgi:hypothetical protein
MTRNLLASLVLATALVAGPASAASSTAPAKPAAAPATQSLKSVIAKWKDSQVRIVKDGTQIEVKDLLAVGDDFIKIGAAEGETYIPLSRIKSLNVQGDKLFIHLN